MEEDLEKIDRGENSLNEFEKELSESSLLKEFETILKHYVALKYVIIMLRFLINKLS